MAGPEANMAKGWGMIRSNIKTEDPLPAGKYLGCDHRVHTLRLPDGVHPLTSGVGGAKPEKGTRVVRAMEYDMGELLKQCVQRYQDLAGPVAPRCDTLTPHLSTSKPFGSRPRLAMSER